MNDATFIYESLLKDYIFMNKIDHIISTILTDCTIEPTDIPALLLQIIDCLQEKFQVVSLKRNITPEEAYKLFELYRVYIVQKIVCEFDLKEFNKVYNNCLQLTIMNLGFVKKKTSWLCFKTEA